MADDLVDGTTHRLHPRVSGWPGPPPARCSGSSSRPWRPASPSPTAAPPPRSAWFVALAVPWVLAAWGLARWRYAWWSWTAWPDALELAHGRVVHRASLVPYHRIQQIDISRGPFARTFGLSTLILRTAAATSDAELPGIGADHAEALRRELLARAGVDDAV